MAAISKASLLMTLMAVLLALVGAAQAQKADAPAPSPTSAALSTSPSLGWALLCSVVALVFGSARRV
ncbi:hypothetical protein I3843_15G037100 [Carya illinoinensis]|uniref:Uncharacterized protein n=1 Tax=Carya illinoinensis TaxID=32201 RepID=A0A8T1N469_CARIL|nr:hypothetical protein CIPAW_15G042100 [Carya illinoinensis]KAG6674426.1 hypothetical protein I3842_15G041000 [Carya illinoinensis]KAG7943408.1 hypothetical protein I3843_15G037100 [Carya illinoinensis]